MEKRLEKVRKTSQPNSLLSADRWYFFEDLLAQMPHCKNPKDLLDY